VHRFYCSRIWRMVYAKSLKSPYFPVGHWCVCVMWLSDRVCSIWRAYRLFHRPAAYTSLRVHRQLVGLLQVSTASYVWFAHLQDLSHQNLAQVWSLHRPSARTRTNVRRQGKPTNSQMKIFVWDMFPACGAAHQKMFCVSFVLCAFAFVWTKFVYLLKMDNYVGRACCG